MKMRARDWTALKVAWWVVGMMAALNAALKETDAGVVGEVVGAVVTTVLGVALLNRLEKRRTK